jgi:hypothetical protein
MSQFCPRGEHVSRRALLKGLVGTAGGLALANWGGLFSSQTSADEARKQGKRCILLWMAGGPSQLDTFDLKPGRRGSGPFRPIATNVTGTHICEYLPRLAKQADKLAIIRSMRTPEPGHAAGTYLMHTGYRPEVAFRYPEIGALVARYLGDSNADLPSFIQIDTDGGESSPTAGSGFLGAAYQPFRLGPGGGTPENTQPYLSAESNQRRLALLEQVEAGFAQDHKAAEIDAHRAAQEKSVRLVRARGVFDLSAEWPKYRDLYGDSPLGKNCLLARRLVEAGAPFVEVGQHNYDSHEDNFEWHKALLPPLDHAWSGLLHDLHVRGLLENTLVVWMGEVGRTPMINNRVGRDHWVKVWSLVLAGGGIRGGIVHGQSDADAAEVKDNPVPEGDFFTTIYTALGIKPGAENMAGVRPVRVAPRGGRVIKELLV